MSTILNTEHLPITNNMIGKMIFTPLNINKHLSKPTPTPSVSTQHAHNYLTFLRIIAISTQYTHAQLIIENKKKRTTKENKH